MTVEQIKELYETSSIKQEIIDATIDLATKYNMLGIFNGATRLATVEERDNYFNTIIVVRVNNETRKRQLEEQKKYEQGMKNLIGYINREIMPHIQSIIEPSNIEITTSHSYETTCMLKSFAIEYILKIIEIVLNISETDIKSYTSENLVEQRFSQLLKNVRDKLNQIELTLDPTARRRTGHEIHELLNDVLPSHISTLIKYRSIANYGIESIVSNGYIPRINDQDKKAFAPDYLLMIKDFIHEDSSVTMEQVASQHNEIYKRNNKGFEEYRYKDRQANLMDYQELNARLASSHMVLEFLLNNAEVFRHVNDTTIDYKYIQTLLTKTEYDNLIAIATTNSYETNEMILYHAFLKQYLKERTPKFNDKRYERINKLFAEIKDAGDISLTSARFIEWYNEIELKSLTPEELQELSVIDPNFIYKSLSYKEKLIYKKCQKYGIKFEYYYKISPAAFEKIIEICGNELSGLSININLFGKTKEEIIEFFALIKDMGLTVREIPDYYYMASAQELLEYYNRLDHTNGENRIIPKRYLQNSLPPNLLQIVEEKRINSETSITGEITHSPYGEELDDILASYQVNRKNYLEEHKSFKHHTPQEAKKISELLGISIEDVIVFSIKYSAIQELLKEKELQELAIDFHKKRSMGLLDTRIMLDEETSAIKQELVATQNIMDKETEVGIDMLFLESEEILLNYKMCQSVIPDIKIGDYLFYKRPLEVRNILNLCKKNNIQFTTDFLYFDYDILLESIREISSQLPLIRKILELNNNQFGYQEARTINQHFIKERNKRGLTISITPELSSMIEESRDSITEPDEKKDNPHK